LRKDRLACISSLDNYRGITLIPVIAKLCELVGLELYSEYHITYNLKFGFKPKLGVLMPYLLLEPLLIILETESAQYMLLLYTSVRH